MTQPVFGLILASASVARKMMLENAGVPVRCVPAQIDEQALKQSLITDGASPRDIADCLAEAKARNVAFQYPDNLVLGGDQILVQDGDIFSKAKTRAEAKMVLKRLSAKSHQLISAAVISHQGQPVWRTTASATLKVRSLSDDYIDEYLDILGEAAFSSVGCYQLEGLGAQLFEKIDGDFFTILGLPLLPVLDFLRARGMIHT
jgi:septum formation protein